MTRDYTRTDNILIDVRNVSLKFGERLILRDISVKIRDITRPDCLQGQVVCFLGPSGIGKTQLSRVIAGLQAPTSGSVSVLHHAGMTPVQRGFVGMVPQTYPLFEFCTVRQNLEVAGRCLQSREKKLLDLADTLGLNDYLLMYPSQLSGGTRQRVAIARQLMSAENFLILDEPFSGQDPIMKGKASELITKLASLDSANTIIIVTHDVTEGLAVSDEAWLMGFEKEGIRTLAGARIVETIDMAKMGICWNPEINTDPEFLRLVGDVKQRFKTLR